MRSTRRAVRSAARIALAAATALACGSSSKSATGPADAATGSEGGTDAGRAPDSGGSADGGGSVDASGTGGTVGGVPGGQAGPGTTLAGCEIFPSDNPWNVLVDGAGVQVIHTYDAKLPQGTHLHADFGDWSTAHYGIPYSVVPATQADVSTTFTLYASESDPGPGGWVGANPVTTNAAMGATAYPFFVGMHIEGDPATGGTPGNLPGDQHAIVLQQGASGCTSWEAWNCAVPTSTMFRCANGAKFDLASSATRPAGWTSGDLAGLSILAGIVKLAEIKKGVVTHAIRVTFNSTQSGYIPPATHATTPGSSSAAGPLGSAFPPMGLRLRLKAAVSISGYTAASQAIMTAMKAYGLMVADIGSDWYFQGDSDDGWAATAPDGKDTIINEVSADFAHLTGADFEAIFSGNPVSTGL